MITRALLAGLVLGLATQGFADVGIMILEPVGTIGFLTRAGHSAIYLSNVCPDRSPVRVRLCHAGERGGVISKYTPISPNEDYDWAIVPLEQFLTGFDSPALAPMLGVPRLQRLIQDYNFGPLFSDALAVADDGHPPDGEWRTTLATRFDRTIYVLSIASTVAQDQMIVDAFNATTNRSRFNFFYDNCSNQAKRILNLILSEEDAVGDRVDGLTMEVPKGVAKSLVDRALKHPELGLHVERYTQLPGTFPRSREALFPFENTYRNISFLPYWYFVGYSEVAIGAMVYHQLLSPFSLVDSMKAFLSPRAAQLTVEQRRLERARGDTWVTPMSDRAARDQAILERDRVNARRVLREVKKAKEIEIRRVLGSKEQWQALEQEFRAIAHDVAGRVKWPDGVQRRLLEWTANGKLSRHLLAHFETHGQFSVEPSARGPWMRIQIAGPEWQSTGLSESEVLSGSPALAFLVLAAVIDDNLSRPDDRREPIDFMNRIFGLLRQTRARLASDFLPGAGAI